jgi:hypothetical protein
MKGNRKADIGKGERKVGNRRGKWELIQRGIARGGWKGGTGKEKAGKM